MLEGLRSVSGLICVVIKRQHVLDTEAWGLRDLWSSGVWLDKWPCASFRSSRP